jgi:hypothetical protein
MGSVIQCVCVCVCVCDKSGGKKGRKFMNSGDKKENLKKSPDADIARYLHAQLPVHTHSACLRA